MFLKKSLSDTTEDSSEIPRNEEWQRHAAHITVSSDIEVTVIQALGLRVMDGSTERWKYWPPTFLQKTGSAKKGDSIELFTGTIVVLDTTS